MDISWIFSRFIDVPALVVLSQYYDPPLRCFTFKYFRLVLTIEEYERLLGWYVKDHPPFTKLGELLMPESVAEALHLYVEEFGSCEPNLLQKINTLGLKFIAKAKSWVNVIVEIKNHIASGWYKGQKKSQATLQYGCSDSSPRTRTS
ncbi:hypothetical protein KIW84_012935 [Lathyrus oleraceus]|uniref:DUF7745 domain-containing protein n=1 Tax=Pisum sativum TaxID=3888 RepID=A0A9D5BJ96_PEA|nr:hypothetical protein KIW84_012935 [Pisum sativum]